MPPEKRIASAIPPKELPAEDADRNTRLYEAWIQRTGQGDRDAFCRLYEKTGRILFSYALSLLHNREDAEDAVQDTFLKIRSAAYLYTPMGKPLAWMLTIERNICLMRLRTKSRFSDLALTEGGAAGTDPYGSRGISASQARPVMNGIPAEGFSTEDVQSPFPRTRDVENRIVLQKALQCLSQEETSIVLLHASGGMKHREIADLMQMPLSTVLSKYRRALGKLRAQLDGAVP